MLNGVLPSSAGDLRRRMNATGIGYAGIDGVWWLPATEPFTLPAVAAEELTRIGAAIFALLDVLVDLYDADDSVRQFLLHDIPQHIPRLNGVEPVLMVRPDFQLVPEGDEFRLVATEIEICPAAQGFTHAMQAGYGLETDLVDHLAQFLSGRPLLIVGTSQWSEFLFEQLALCRALDERGATGFVLYDRTFGEIAAEVKSGQRWQPPIFGVPRRSEFWDEDVLGRLLYHGLERYLWPGDWPLTIGEAVIFRFGYFDCFGPEAIKSFVRWRSAGATFLNPPITYLESKCILAAARLPVVLRRLAAVRSDLPAMLNRYLPETRLLKTETISMLLGMREDWIIKFAGYDGDNQAWGGRSVQFGREHSDVSWEELLRHAVDLPWPVVAQRLTPSAKVDIDYYDSDGRTQRLTGGTTRLRSFLMRDKQRRMYAVGNHVTITAGERVAEGMDAVQAPVLFGRRE